MADCIAGRREAGTGKYFALIGDGMGNDEFKQEET